MTIIRPVNLNEEKMNQHRLKLILERNQYKFLYERSEELRRFQRAQFCVVLVSLLIVMAVIVVGAGYAIGFW